MAVGRSAPADDDRVFADELLLQAGQTHGNDVLFVGDIFGQSNESDIVLKRGRLVARMNLFALNVEVLVGQGLALLADVPLAQPDPHAGFGRVVDAMRGRDHPALADQGTTARDSLRQKRLLDDGRLPRVMAELGVVTTDDPGLAVVVHLAALGVRQRAQIGINAVDLGAVHAAGPDEAAVAQVHGLFALHGAGDAQAAAVLLAPVPAVVGHEAEAAGGGGVGAAGAGVAAE